jgi:hypothetical protein
VVQSGNCKISCVRNFDFHNQKDDGGNVQATKKGINKLPTKPIKEKEKEKEVVVY